MISRDSLASKLLDYLQHRITRTALANWAENAVMEDEFDERDLDTIRDITSRLGLADVREFGLTWDDCEGYLSRIGYRAKVDIVQARRAACVTRWTSDSLAESLKLEPCRDLVPTGAGPPVSPNTISLRSHNR